MRIFMENQITIDKNTFCFTKIKNTFFLENPIFVMMILGFVIIKFFLILTFNPYF